MEKMYSLREIWETLGIKMRVLRDWVKRGKLPAVKMQNRKWYVTEEQYIRLKEQKGHADKD